MNKHIFKTSELPILAAIVLLIKLAAIIDAPSGQAGNPIERLNTPGYSLAGFDDINLYVLDYGYLITQTGLSDSSASFIFISEDSPEYQHFKTSARDSLPQMEKTAEIVTGARGPANVSIAGISMTSGAD